MRYGKIYEKRAAAALCALSALLLSSFLTACGDGGGNTPELPGEPRLCTVGIRLRAAGGMRPATKAAVAGDPVPGTAWEEDDEYERRMDRWLVAAYDAEGNYAGHTEGAATGTDTGGDGAVDCSMELPEGRYTFFAFANWESLEGWEADGFIPFIKKQTVEALEAYAVRVGDIDDKFNRPADGAKKPVPMSSYGHPYTVSATAAAPTTDVLSIPLIRMIGKVRVEFRNGLLRDVEITDVTIGRFNDDRPVFWVPWKVGEYDHYLEFADGFSDPYPHKGPTFPDGNVSAPTGKTYSLGPTADSPLTVPQTTGQDQGTPVSCYVNESMLGSANWTSNMTLSVSRRYAGEGGKVTTVEQPTDFAFVRRNDLLEIPVLLSDIGATLSFGEVRLPIGVYPTTFEFGVENGVQILTPITYHVKSTGVLKVRYELNAVGAVGGDAGWQIRYPSQSAIGGMKYSSIQVLQNGSDLLVDPETNETLVNNSSLRFDDTVSEESKRSGSFTLRTQELGGDATATILLTLIVEYGAEGNRRDIEIPYTIHITNAPQTSGETTKGGNA